MGEEQVGKQTLNRIKKTLVILLLVLYVATLTAGAVRAASAVGSCDRTQTSCTGDEGTYRIECSSDGSQGDDISWNFGDGKTSSAEDTTHIYHDCLDHDVHLTVTDSSDNSEDTQFIGTY